LETGACSRILKNRIRGMANLQLMNNKVILSVTAHPDDEVLGFGATAAKFVLQGAKVYNCILSGNVEARRFRPELKELLADSDAAQAILGCETPIFGEFPNIQFNTVPHLHLVQFIEKVIEDVGPDYIFTHFPYDLNNDHYHVSRACQAASRLYQRKEVKRIAGLFFMEIPSSTDWAYPVGGNIFNPNTYVEVGLELIEKKIQALEAYKGVMRPFPHPRSHEILKGLAAFRGGQSGLIYAEAFQSVFLVL
jgi:LmbE family N-acetylglucosaminyl deacetylase